MLVYRQGAFRKTCLLSSVLRDILKVIMADKPTLRLNLG